MWTVTPSSLVLAPVSCPHGTWGAYRRRWRCTICTCLHTCDNGAAHMHYVHMWLGEKWGAHVSLWERWCICAPLREEVHMFTLLREEVHMFTLLREEVHMFSGEREGAQAHVYRTLCSSYREVARYTCLLVRTKVQYRWERESTVLYNVHKWLKRRFTYLLMKHILLVNKGNIQWAWEARSEHVY